MRLRKIMRYAGMWVIKLLPADIIDFNLMEGQEVDINEPLTKIKKVGRIRELKQGERK